VTQRSRDKEPTPRPPFLPWRADDGLIFDAAGHIVADCDNDEHGRKWPEYDAVPMIVRAVNLHDDLVEALDDLAAAFENVMLHHGNAMPMNDQNQRARTLARARSVLARVEDPK